MLEIIFSFVEWYGIISILGAYGMTMFNVIPFQSPLFYILNLTGSIGLVIGSAFKRHLWHNLVFYFIWAVITSIVYFNPFNWTF